MKTQTPLPQVFRTCYCPNCRAAENARQRKIFFFTLPAFVILVCWLWSEVSK